MVVVVGHHPFGVCCCEAIIIDESNGLRNPTQQAFCTVLVINLCLGCGFLDRQEQLELWRQLLLGVQSVGEIQTAYTAVCVDLHSESLYVVGTVSAPGEIGEVELNLVPALIQAHWHGANERLHTGGTLVVGSPEPSPHVLVIQNLDLESEVFLELQRIPELWKKQDQEMTRLAIATGTPIRPASRETPQQAYEQEEY